MSALRNIDWVLFHKQKALMQEMNVHPWVSPSYKELFSGVLHMMDVVQDEFGPSLVPAGYTAEELEKDNPFNAWMHES